MHSKRGKYWICLLIYHNCILWQKYPEILKLDEALEGVRARLCVLFMITKKILILSPGKKVYNTTAYFTNKNILFTLNFNHNDETTMETFLEESVNYDYVIKMSKKPKVTTKNPPSPFTTSTTAKCQ